MPTYDYECSGCNHKFELFQGINDALKKKCPECGKNKLKRLFGTGAAIVFKGSGFYQTDYRSESYKKAAASDAAATSSSESKSSETKTETKSETKPAKKSSSNGKESK